MRRLVNAASLTTRPGHLVEQFLLADHPVAMLYEVGEQVVHLRLELDTISREAQLVARQVEFIVLECANRATTSSVFVIFGEMERSRGLAQYHGKL
jgi:hypothetical protein